ncbi:hypothetical protein [Natronorubrum bangense]|uniref:Right handed beta helix domain-containing protein n=2 Tax=Natronorubrum bangense TaxID=61858 RepID=L9W787_9EURY|nr:hypothetical protein [Natronorubrum bangense]ELY45339.1 hypothetical protein C494_15723 [Natronorubrum bangense JCM 10635]QCC56816.1 hypothetical protein DV706_19965 [Natronorubrum bangense]
MTKEIQDATNNSLLNRRSYLKGAGAAAALIGLGGAAAASDEDDYDVIEVSSGETWTYNMDNGETLENLLIDITASGASWEIRMHGDDMTLRNIGIRGNVDSPQKMNHISVGGSSGSSNCVIENIYYEGYTLSGFNNAVGTGGTATPIFVSPNHSGDLLVRNVNLQSCPDNLIYASAPGNGSEHPAPGGGGTVRVEDSYLFRTGAGCVRVGTEGSYAENCILDGDHSNTAAPNSRPFWGYYEHTEIRNCDVMNGSPGAVVAGASAWDKGRRAEVTVEDSYFEDTGTHASGAQIHGSSADREPRTEPSEIEGVPLSAEEAASGSSGSSPSQSPSPSSPENGDDDEDDSSIEDVWEDNESNHVELRGGTPDQIAEYEILGSGDAEAGENADTNPDDPYRDVVTTDGDDFLVEGFLGGHVDDFYITGSITDVETTADLTATVNGHEFDVQELEGVGSWDGDDDAETSDLPHAIVIDGAEAAGTTDYSLSVSEEIVQSEYSGATIDDGDKVEGTTASGTVDDGIDAYRFCGEITDFWLAGEADVTLEYDADN